MPPRPWPRPTPVADCKECGHRHAARCQHILGKEGAEIHLCGCQGTYVKKQIPVPSPRVERLM